MSLRRAKGGDFTCYIQTGWAPRIRTASPQRAWMDDGPERFAYRCLPLNIANAHGWELLSPCGFEAEWNGGPAPGDVVIRTDPGTEPRQAPVGLFGQGVLTFHVEGLFRTPPGCDLWVGGAPNSAKDGLAPLSGVIETDWSPFGFTMNWRFTRAGQKVRFEENEPFCFFFPLDRRLIEQMQPRIAPLAEDPELKRRFEQWSASRDAFQARVAAEAPEKPADRWQKFYYRGLDADGAPGAADHRAKLRLAEFAGAEPFHRGPPPPSACPASAARSSSGARPATPADEAPPPGKLDWLLASMERLRALSGPAAIACRRDMGADEFLEKHYAANWPVLLRGELAGWPALERWTPDYLRGVIGAGEVEVQAGRRADDDFERNMAAHTVRMPFDGFMDQISRPGAGNDLYLTAYNSVANEAALAPLRGDLGVLDKLLAQDGDRPHGLMWIGPAGTFTPLHHDLTNNLLLQIVGRKRVLLAAPADTPRLYNDHHVYSRVRDLTEAGVVDRFPRLEGLRVHQLVMEPGDALFIPLAWWHQVEALAFSVTITHTNFRWPNDFHATYPA